MHCLEFGEPSGIEAILHKVPTEPISSEDFAVCGGLDLDFK